MYRTQIGIDDAIVATDENKQKAIDFLLKLQPEGGTNINLALTEAVKLANDIISMEVLSYNTKPNILFLTDGEPTSGVTHDDTIISNVKSANTANSLPIHTLAFGKNADRNLIEAISHNSDGKFKRIYEANDAAIQIEDLYQEISNTLLLNVRFTYYFNDLNHIVYEALQKTYFRGDGIVVNGKLPSVHTTSVMTATITGEGAKGSFEEHIDICLNPESPSDRLWYKNYVDSSCLIPDHHGVLESNYIQRLYKFLTIRELLEKDDDAAAESQALKLALDSNFVTKLTSLIIYDKNRKLNLNIYKTLEIKNEKSRKMQNKRSRKISKKRHGGKNKAYKKRRNGTKNKRRKMQKRRGRKINCSLTLYSQTFKRGKIMSLNTSLADLKQYNDLTVTAEVKGNSNNSFIGKSFKDRVIQNHAPCLTGAT